MNTTKAGGFRREFWRRHVEQHRTSGMTQAKYAAEHGLKHQTLSMWVNKLAREAGAVRKGPGRPRKVATTFAKVNLPHAPRSSTADVMRLSFPGGVSLDLSSGFDVLSIAKLIATVGGSR